MKLTTDIIRLSEVLEQMDNVSEPFDITICTADEKKGTGGKIKELKNCRKTGTGRNAGESSGQNSAPLAKLGKNPNHFRNATRNIILQNGQTRTICIYLILFFNGKKVII